MNAKNICDVERNGIIERLEIERSSGHLDCDICLRGKMTRTPFPKGSDRVTEPLEIVHSDVCGPMRTESNGKAKYCVTFINNHSQWCEVRVLKSKSEVFGAFKDFVTMEKRLRLYRRITGQNMSIETLMIS